MVSTRARSIKFRQIFLPTGGMSGYKDVITSRKMGKNKNKPLQHHHVFCCSCRFHVLNPTFWKRSTNFYTFNDFRWVSSPRFFHDFSHYFSPVMPTAQAPKKKKLPTRPTYPATPHHPPPHGSLEDRAYKEKLEIETRILKVLKVPWLRVCG